MFSQITTVLLGLFLIATGSRKGDYLAVGIGILARAFAATPLYELKTGK